MRRDAFFSQASLLRTKRVEGDIKTSSTQIWTLMKSDYSDSSRRALKLLLRVVSIRCGFDE